MAAPCVSGGARGPEGVPPLPSYVSLQRTPRKAGTVIPGLGPEWHILAALHLIPHSENRSPYKRQHCVTSTNWLLPLLEQISRFTNSSPRLPKKSAGEPALSDTETGCLAGRCAARGRHHPLPQFTLLALVSLASLIALASLTVLQGGCSGGCVAHIVGTAVQSPGVPAATTALLTP